MELSFVFGYWDSYSSIYCGNNVKHFLFLTYLTKLEHEKNLFTYQMPLSTSIEHYNVRESAGSTLSAGDYRYCPR
jgi:hypothetical protein